MRHGNLSDGRPWEDELVIGGEKLSSSLAIEFCREEGLAMVNLEMDAWK